MSLDLYLAYLLATTVLLVIPGPTILLVVGFAVSRGRRTALWTAPGVAPGDATAMVASLAGLGAVMATSATAFIVMKWLGALYLIYLGLTMWRAAPAPGTLAPTD